MNFTLEIGYCYEQMGWGKCCFGFLLRWCFWTFHFSFWIANPWNYVFFVTLHSYMKKMFFSLSIFFLISCQASPVQMCFDAHIKTWNDTETSALSNLKFKYEADSWARCKIEWKIYTNYGTIKKKHSLPYNKFFKFNQFNNKFR